MTPEVGKKYYWLRTPKSLYVIDLLKAGPLTLHAKLYMGYGNDCEGTVEWTQEEWECADLLAYWPGVREADLDADEELCRMCDGSGWETLRDLEICTCLWCGRTGRQKKRPPSPPPPVSRSPLHPFVP